MMLSSKGQKLKLEKHSFKINKKIQEIYLNYKLKLSQESTTKSHLNLTQDLLKLSSGLKHGMTIIKLPVSDKTLLYDHLFAFILSSIKFLLIHFIDKYQNQKDQIIIFISNMRYFSLSESVDKKSQGILRLNEQSSTLIIQICRNLKIPLQGLHLALWLFHCQVKLLSYHKFDRFVYICAAILVATKVGEHMRNPVDILHQLRNILRRKKNLTTQDSQQFTRKYLRRIFEAEVNIMINIGFDFDISLAIRYMEDKLKNQLRSSDLIDKLKQTLTSLYKTETVVYFDSELIAITALDILMRNQGINVELSNFSHDILDKLKKQEIKQIKSFYLNHCFLE